MHRSEWLLLALIGAGLALAGIVWLAFGSGPERRPLERVAATWKLEPGGQKAAPAAAPEGAAGELGIYLDASLPIGGYLAPSGPSPGSGLEALVRFVPDNLAKADSGLRSPLRWRRIAAAPAALAGKPPLERRFFDGRESRLDVALTEIERGLVAGRLEAAVVITDLVATGEIVGAQGVAQALRDFTSSEAVRGGSFQLGLLALRAPYWGVRAAGCDAPAGRPGCRFSEQRQAWIAVPAGATAPLYALIFTRGREAALEVLGGLGRDLEQRGFTVQSELLTAATAALETRVLECSLRDAAEPNGTQFALFAQGDGTFSCERATVVNFHCPLPDELETIESITEAGGERLPFAASSGRGVAIELDCSTRRDRRLRLEMRMRGQPRTTGGTDWAGWSSITDDQPEDLGKTLRLKELVDRVRVRPDFYQASVEFAPRERPHER